MEIDIDKLRKDLESYFGTAMFSGFSQSMMELEEVQNANAEELIAIAERSRFNINDYIVKN